MNIFWGELTDNSAEKEALLALRADVCWYGNHNQDVLPIRVSGPTEIRLTVDLGDMSAGLVREPLRPCSGQPLGWRYTSVGVLNLFQSTVI